MAGVDVVVNLRSLLGEGPIWDHRTGLVAWVDILGELVHLTEPHTGITTSVPVGAPVGALALQGGSDYLLAIGNGFASLSNGRLGDLASAFDTAGVRMNDGAVDPTGRFLAGSMGDGQRPAGSVYVREANGSVRTLFGDVTISNGIGWSKDGATMYYVDSATQSIDAIDYDVELGQVRQRSTLVRIEEADGTPDGLTVDGEGCIWVALWDGGCVRRYSPTGGLLRQLDLPVSRVTSCAFGGPDLDRLFITTAAVGIDTEGPAGALAGALFVADPDVRGVPSVVVPDRT